MPERGTFTCSADPPFSVRFASPAPKTPLVPFDISASRRSARFFPTSSRRVPYSLSSQRAH